jgi:protease I
MTQMVLEGVRIAVLAADGFEQDELTRPVKALQEHGADVEIVSLRPGKILGMNLLVPGKRIEVDRTIFAVDPDEYHGLHIPGGFINPDFLRQSERVLDFVRAFDAAGKPITTLCHGPWVLISAGLVRGRRLASWPGIKDDVRNAGAEWVDEKVVHDGNWVSSRTPLDLPAFDKAIVAHFAEAVGRPAPGFVRDIGWGRWLVGTAAVAAAGLVVRRTLQHRAGEEWEAEPAEFASGL